MSLIGFPGDELGQYADEVYHDLSEGAYCRFLAAGAELLLRKGKVHVRALQRGPVTAEAVLVQPGRPHAGGRLQFSAS